MPCVRLGGVPEAFRLPIGLRLSQAARTVSRAFDEALAEAGGSLPARLILLNLKIRKPANQRKLAEAGGIPGATLAPPLNAMDAPALVSRAPDAPQRPVHAVQVTPAR